MIFVSETGSTKYTAFASQRCEKGKLNQQDHYIGMIALTMWVNSQLLKLDGGH